MTRSQFLMAGAALAIPAMAAERTAAEEANLALSSNPAQNGCRRGGAAVERIKSYVERSSRIEFKILDSSVRGPMVINERIDSFTRPDASLAYHLVGVFFIKDGKIAEWTDYGIRD